MRKPHRELLPKKLTPDQEKKLQTSERLAVRAEIYTLGAAEIIKRGEYCGLDALEESASALRDAAALRRESYRLKDEVEGKGKQK